MLHVRDVSVRYGSLTALECVTVDIRQGERTVLLGRSAAGKTTLLRCLNYLQTPTRGTVSVDGIGPLTDRHNLRLHRRRTGTVFQMHHLLPRHTALKNVLVGRLGYHSTLRSLLPLPRRDVDLALNCLERVGLLGKALTRADQLSGGERQRVGIARALCQEPTLLLADEPVASLDPATAEEILTLLCAVCRQSGLTLVMSLHQLELARRFGDRIVGLAAGRIVFDGPPNALTAEHLRTIYGTTPESSAAASSPGSDAASPLSSPTRTIENDQVPLIA
jgi:phosphonate transport system ATP-binding protein